MKESINKKITNKRMTDNKGYKKTDRVLKEKNESKNEKWMCYAIRNERRRKKSTERERMGRGMGGGGNEGIREGGETPPSFSCCFMLRKHYRVLERWRMTPSRGGYAKMEVWGAIECRRKAIQVPLNKPGQTTTWYIVWDCSTQVYWNENVTLNGLMQWCFFPTRFILTLGK